MSKPNWLLAAALLSAPLLSWSLSFVFSDGSVYFSENDAALTAEDVRTLEAAACHAARNNEAVRVEGYASAPEREPDRLAEERASAVKRVLVQFGVDEARITVATHGARLPVASEGDADGRAKNRRVDFGAGRISGDSNCGPITRGSPRL